MNEAVTKKRNPRRRRAPVLQATSMRKIHREKCKQVALEYRTAGFASIRAIADAINTMFGPGGEAELPRFKSISHHLVHTLLTEAIRESVDPLKKEELRNIELAQIDGMIAAAYTPASNGSTMHIDAMLKLHARKSKLLGLDNGEEGESGGTSITQYFVNGALANV